MAGAPGFEPGIAGPKPAALPLGYAPLFSSIGTGPTGQPAASQTAAPAKPPSGIASDVAALGYAPLRREYRQGYSCAVRSRSMNRNTSAATASSAIAMIATHFATNQTIGTSTASACEAAKIQLS